MVDENSPLSTFESHDIIKSDMDPREFKITIGIRSYWITREERDKYLTDREKPGVEYVALRDGLMLLPVKYQELVHRSVIEDSEKIENGRWQCEAGSWHNAGAHCYCNVEMIETEEGTMRLVEKSTKTLPAPVKEDIPRYPASRYLSGALKSF